MSLKSHAAPWALLIAACAAAPALAAPPDPASPAGPDQTTGPEPVRVDTVIVTGRRDPEDPPVVAEARARLSRTPGAVSVVSAEAYQNRAAQGLYDILRDAPGVLAQKRFGEEARLSIRGSGLSQAYHQRGVLFAQDGVPFADADGFSDFQKIDPLGARYVEVYRGGNALRFGGAQLGGALNFVTPTGRTAAQAALIRLEGGAYGLRRGQLALARDWGEWDAYASLSGLEADGFRDHSEQQQARFSLNLGRSFGEDREVRLIVSAAEVEQAVPGTLSLADALTRPRMANPATVANNWRRDVDVARATLQTRWRLADDLVFEGGVYVTDDTLWHPIPVVLDNHNRTWGGFGRLDWDGAVGGRRADLFVGAYYRSGELDSRVSLNFGGVPSPFLVGSAQQQATGLDLFAEGRLFVTEQLAVVAGGSFGRATRDYVDNLGANSDQITYDWFSPRLGLLWEAADGSQVFANVTRSEEPPIYDSLRNSSFTGIGFVPLETQKAWTGEIGARGRRGPLLWDVTLYRAQVRDELLNYVITPGIPSATFNAGDTVHQGLEAALDWALTEDAPGGGRLSLRQSWTWSDFRFDGDAVYGDNRLPVIPEHQYRAELKYAHPAGWFIAPAVEWRPGDVWVDYANTMKAPGYAVWSVSAGWTINDHVAFYVDARNLTDKAYAPEFGAVTDALAPGVSTEVFYPGEGRAVFVGLRLAY